EVLMTPPVVARRYTPEDLLAIPDGHRFDLVDGCLVERHMGAESSWIALQVNRHLSNYVAPAQGAWFLGRIVAIKSSLMIPTGCVFPMGRSSVVGVCRTMRRRAAMCALCRIWSLRWCRPTTSPGKLN